MITKIDATKLAINYQAFCESLEANRDSGLATWGPMLLASQEKTGIELLSASIVRALVDGANARAELAADKAASVTLAAIDTEKQDEARCRLLATQDESYRAKKLHGRWVVWSDASDHVVEF